VAETLFELRVERLFAEAPSLADAEAFAGRTLERISRGWLARRAVIGSMGVLGGLIGGFEVVSTGALGQFSGLVAQAPGWLAHAASLSPAVLPLDLRAVAAAVVLALVGVAYGLARPMRGF
jgi:hypothetical protein